jgi:sulfate adenylyltransferase subunit 2
MYQTDFLDQLENEAIYIIREAYALCDRSAILFSGGKDSIVLAHLAHKAFLPYKKPITLLHIDTGHNFEETMQFIEGFTKKYGFSLSRGFVQDDIDSGKIEDLPEGRNVLQSYTLMKCIKEMKLDGVIGGGRRDEEKARAKERVFSHRNQIGQWDPNNQRPELWGIYNAYKNEGEHFRIFPLSNWTEKDVWRYIKREKLDLPSLYFAHKRIVVEKSGMILAHSSYTDESNGKQMMVRCRTIGDMTCTGLWQSTASNIDEVLLELDQLTISERGGRADDKISDTAMEDRKRQGYF